MNDTRRLIADLIRSEMALLGPGVALSLARKVNGLKLGGNGDILSVAGDEQSILDELTGAYTAFSPEAARLALEHVAARHPHTPLV